MIGNKKRFLGQAMIDFALVIPILFLLFIFIFDLGRVTYYNTVMNNASREAARYGSINPDGDIALVAEQALYGMNPSDVSITVSTAETGTVIVVSINFTFRPATPLVANIIGGDGTVPLSTQASSVIED